MVFEHLVPLHREDWSFFERQRSVFKSMFSDMDDDFRSFDAELERMRREMFSLMGDSTSLKVDRPFVQDTEGNKKLALRFDVSQFKPDEVTVKTMDNKLMVHAKHTEESPGRKVYREYSKSYVLPNKIDPMTLNSILSNDGVLSIEAPAPASVEAPKERILPIKFL